MYTLKDKVAVVTGAGSGIGRALAQNLAARGCRLAISDINEAGLAETVASIPGAKLLSQKLDVADREAVYAFAEKVKQEFGAVHVVINNAGVAVAETVVDLSYKDFEWLMNINFWGVVYGTKSFLPGMLAQNEGTIVNVSSIFGIIAVPTQGSYNAAKFAVRGFTEALRHELDEAKSKVRAICVHPGGIKTNIVRNGRFYKNPQGVADKARISAEFDRMARTTPARAAEVIVRGIEHGTPRVLIGQDAKAMDRLQRWMPVRYWSVMGALLRLIKR